MHFLLLCSRFSSFTTLSTVQVSSKRVNKANLMRVAMSTKGDILLLFFVLFNRLYTLLCS